MTQERMHDEHTGSDIDNSKKRNSVVKQELCFDENHWVVSILNTKEKEFGGHAVILVEGIRNGELFVGRYDVFAATIEQTEDNLSSRSSFFSAINAKGYIANVRMEESNSYNRIACHVVLMSNSIEEVPTSISKHEVILQKVNDNVIAYWLDGSRIRQKSVSIQSIECQNNLKFPELGEARHLIKPTDDEALIKEITALCGYEHPDGATFYSQCLSRSFLKSVQNIEKMIDSIREDKVRTSNAHLGNDTYIQYQYLGSEKSYGLLKLFSESGRGINCAEWCLEKLKVADIQLEVKPMPTPAAGGVCTLL